MGRIGGGSIVEQIALVHGCRPVDIIKHVIDLSVFSGAHMPEFPYGADRYTAATLSFNYCLADADIYVGVTCPDDPSCTHTQFAVEGKAVSPAGISDYSWLGSVSGPAEATKKYMENLVVHTATGDKKAFYITTEIITTRAASLLARSGPIMTMSFGGVGAITSGSGSSVGNTTPQFTLSLPPSVLDAVTDSTARPDA